MPKEIVSDNDKAFESVLYTLLLSRLEIKIRHTTPGCPWENGHAESLIGTLRDYLYLHMNRQKTVGGARRIYRDKVDYYNNRVLWEFQKDEIKTPLEKLAGRVGSPMPEDFSLEVIETTKPSDRTVSPQGWISIRRYQLYVTAQLAKEKVQIREFVTNLVISYAGSAVVTYKYCEQTETSPICRLTVQHYWISELRKFVLKPIPITRDPVCPRFEIVSIFG